MTRRYTTVNGSTGYVSIFSFPNATSANNYCRATGHTIVRPVDDDLENKMTFYRAEDQPENSTAYRAIVKEPFENVEDKNL